MSDPSLGQDDRHVFVAPGSAPINPYTQTQSSATMNHPYNSGYIDPASVYQQQYAAYPGAGMYYGASQQAGFGTEPGFVPPTASTQENQGEAFAIPGLNATGMNPLNFVTAGSNLIAGSQSWGQQYMQRVQKRMGWLSGGSTGYNFAVSKQYVLTKLVMLLAPYLKRWTYTRQPEQIQGGQPFRPPRVDPNAPDLYIPLMAAWTYVVLLCGNALLQQKYSPDLMYSLVWSSGSAWCAHCLLSWVLLKAMSLPTMVPWAEIAAYSGYTFVPACVVLLLSMIGGSLVWWISWIYCSLCSAIFLVRTMKRIIFQEARSYGQNLTLTNYLLLSLALFQFPFLLWLVAVDLPSSRALGDSGSL